MSILSKLIFQHAMRYLLVLLFLTISLILAACGGSSGNGNGAGNGAGTGVGNAAVNSDLNEIPQVIAGATSSSTQSAEPTALDSDNTCGMLNFQAEFIAFVNAARAKGAVCGTVTRQPSQPLVWNDLLGMASVVHSTDMARHNFFDHNSPRTGSLRERIHNTGFLYEEAGENLAGGQTSIAKVVNDWLQSPSHCANMLNPEFKVLGAACKHNATSYYKFYWTLEMALPLGEARSEARETGKVSDDKNDDKNDLEDKQVQSSKV